MVCALLREVACEFWPFTADPGRLYSSCRSCFSCAMFPHETGAAQWCRLALAPITVAGSISPGPGDVQRLWHRTLNPMKTDSLCLQNMGVSMKVQRSMVIWAALAQVH